MSQFESFKCMPIGFSMDQAVAEAERCLLCHDAPCTKACPAATDPGTFIRKLRFKNVTGAIRTIKENNILGGACGVLCPADRLCEKECCATGISRPIEIAKIQRFLVEHSWERDLKLLDTPAPNGKRVAVIGSGPAGLSCAAELAQQGYQVTVFESRPEAGGVIRYGVPSYRYDSNFLNHELQEIRDLGVEFRCNTPIRDKGQAEALLTQGFDAVFIGTGLWASARLKPDVPKAEGLFTSVEFLAALRDGQLEKMQSQLTGKTVSVIGGGSVALDCAESAVKLGAKDVYLIYRRSFTQMPAEEGERIEALAAGVHYLLLNQPVDYVLSEDNIMTGLRLVRTKLAAAEGTSRRAPQEIAGSEWQLDTDIVIEAIGNQAENDSPAWYPHVEVDKSRLIQTNAATLETSVAGIFAGGDVVRGPALVVNAVQDGKLAAKSINAYLSQKEA